YSRIHAASLSSPYFPTRRSSDLIVQLNNFVIRQFVQFTPRQMMATQNIRYRTGTLEVLLHQAQLFTGSMVVVWIENFGQFFRIRSEEHTSELQSRFDLVCRLLLE